MLRWTANAVDRHRGHPTVYKDDAVARAVGIRGISIRQHNHQSCHLIYLLVLLGLAQKRLKL